MLLIAIIVAAVLALAGMNLGMYMENTCESNKQDAMGKLCFDNGRYIRMFSITALIVISVVGTWRVITTTK